MPLVNVIRGDAVPPSMVNVRTPIVRVGWLPLICWQLLKGLVRLIVFAVKHWQTTLTLIAVWWLFAHTGWLGLVLIAAILILASAVLWWLSHPLFLRFVWSPLLARMRRFVYVRSWNAAMSTASLAVRWDQRQVFPQLRKVTCTRVGDVLTVRMVTGQVPDDFAKASLRLAHTFKAQGCRVAAHPRRPDLVTIMLRRRDTLRPTVAALPPAEVPNFTALPAGLIEDGRPLRLRLLGTHLLIVGATGAGKGSALWSIIAALAGGIRSGVVKVWAFDPKGGMELAFGQPLFDRFLCEDFAGMADALEEAVGVLQERARRLRGVTRQHIPTADDPLYLIVVDELAALIAYVTDRHLKDRIKNALNMILSQGRAVGVHVVAAVQDPRKETLTVRDLFPTRIALRLSEPGHVDLALNEGARDRGALCDQIPLSGAEGVAYLMLEGDPTPTRIRFSYWTDDQIKDLAREYGRLRVVADRAGVAA